MLAKKFKLPGSLYPDLLATRNAVNHPLITLKSQKNNSFSRLGLLVGKKISPQAVIRNRVKRQLSEAWRLLFSQIKPGADVLLLPRPALAQKKFSEIKLAIKEVLVKARLLNDPIAT